MRKTFVQILREGNVSIEDEYSKLYELFYDGKSELGLLSVADIISEHFIEYYFRGTCIDLDDFDKKNGFNFVRTPTDFDIDYLVSFCEYVYNLVCSAPGVVCTYIRTGLYVEQILRIIEDIGYMQCVEDGFTIFVPKDSSIIAVAESNLIPTKVSYKVLEYNHHSMRGDLESKKHILLILADLLEANRSELENEDKNFAKDLFYALNKFHIRHNNIDPAGPKFVEVVAAMSDEELEKWYDEIYQMCLLAFMKIEHIDRKKKFNEIKFKIESK